MDSERTCLAIDIVTGDCAVHPHATLTADLDEETKIGF